MRINPTLTDNGRSSVDQHPVLNTCTMPTRQGGTSVLTIIVILLVVGFISLFAFKVVPGYLEFATVKSIGSDIAGNQELLKKPKSKVMLAINQAYRTNSLYKLKPEETFVLTRDGNKGFLVEIDYEKRANLFKNIDVVTRFNHTY